MYWVKTKPTLPGAYWAVPKDVSSPTMVLVSDDLGKSDFCVMSWGDKVSKDINDFDCWSGPFAISPPPGWEELLHSNAYPKLVVTVDMQHRSDGQMAWNVSNTVNGERDPNLSALVVWDAITALIQSLIRVGNGRQLLFALEGLLRKEGLICECPPNTNQTQHEEKSNVVGPETQPSELPG